jgi:signal transduction histidine kinase
VNLGKEGFIFVVDRTGTLVTYPKIQAFRQIQNYSIYEPVAKVISGNEGIGEFSTFVSDKEDVEQKTPNFLLIPQLLFKGCGIGKWDDIIREKWLTAYTPVKNLGFTLEGSNPKNWGVIAIQPSTKAFEPVVKSAQKIIAFSIVLLLIGILFAFIFASIYNKNIKLNEQLTIANENLRAREKELEAQRQALEVQNFNLSILNSVALSMSQSLNLNKIFEQVLEETLKACNVDTGAILTIDVQTNELIISTEKGLSDYPKKSKIEESFAGLSLKSGQSMIINDAKTNDYFPDSIEGTIGLKALVCIPFKTISRPMGVLLVASKNLRNFSETEFKLLNSISNQIGIAAENARLYRVIEQHDREVTIANQNKSEMLKSISHQIRTPLNGIIGCAKVLLDKTYGELNDKQSKYIKNVLISGKILLQLSNDIIDLSRIESETFELYKDDFYFNEVINEIKDIMGQLISANGIILKIDVDNNIEKINADKIRVTQVMYNLLNNALRFTTRNGEIIIEAKQNNSGIEVSIIDSGTLINSEDFEKVFIEFQKPAKPNSRLYDGTGLGMSLSKKFVEMHGGKIWIEHTPDKKNKFIFTIPK